VQGVGAALGEVCTETVAADIFHLVLVGERWNSTCCEFSSQSFVEEDEVGEASADSGDGFGEGGEIGLRGSVGTWNGE